MKSSSRYKILAPALGLAFLHSTLLAQRESQTKPGQTDVPVKTVVLFSSGVGYFEHGGSVKGSASTELRFKTAQINDILKSLVLQDLDRGTVSTVTYPSQDPLAKTLRSFQVDITGNPPLAELLNQLRGAKVGVSIGTEKLNGTILGVEKKQKPVDKEKVVDVWVMNLIIGGLIRAIPLDETRGIELEDPQLRDELNKALSALAQARDQDKKPVTINFKGDGERRVRIGYVVETAVWKTSYRLGLAEQGQPKPMLQGWAIVENQTDNDWNNVQLSLVSGRPISFIQDLYQPLYVPRPVVQPELYSSLTPQTYEGGVDRQKEQVRFGTDGAVLQRKALAEAKGEKQARGRAVNAATAAPGAAAAFALASDRDDKAGLLEMTKSIESVASAAKVGELFQYTIGSVSLPRQRSAMLPIINEEIDAEKLSIYNQGVLQKNPLNGVRMKNTTKNHLLQGPITVFDGGTYAGDARIDDVPPGQQRLLSYAIDLETRVDATKNKNDTSILTGKIVKGVLHLQRKQVFTQDYIAENKSEKDKTLLIEHPLRAGWKLVDTDKPVETTEALYRFQGKLPASKTTRLTVKEERVDGETIAILPLDPGQIELYSRTGEIPQPVRDALAKAAALKRAMLDTERQINERHERINQITQEQNRLRDNMKTVTQNSDYYNRLLKKLNDQESQIEKMQGETDDLQKKRDQQRKEFEDYLANTTIG